MKNSTNSKPLRGTGLRRIEIKQIFQISLDMFYQVLLCIISKRLLKTPVSWLTGSFKSCTSCYWCCCWFALLPILTRQLANFSLHSLVVLVKLYTQVVLWHLSLMLVATTLISSLQMHCEIGARNSKLRRLKVSGYFWLKLRWTTLTLGMQFLVKGFY
jgi:hypothetical protein